MKSGSVAADFFFEWGTKVHIGTIVEEHDEKGNTTYAAFNPRGKRLIPNGSSEEVIQFFKDNGFRLRLEEKRRQERIEMRREAERSRIDLGKNNFSR
jgi:hypothetical protein